MSDFDGSFPCPSCGRPRTGPVCMSCGHQMDPASVPAFRPTEVTYSAMAIASLATTLLTLGCGSILGIAFGIIGLKETSLPLKKGRGLAWAGIVVGIIGLAVPLALSLSSIHWAEKSADAACSTELRSVQIASAAYRAQYGRYPNETANLVDRGMLADTPRYYQIDSSRPAQGAVIRTAAGESIECPVADREVTSGIGPGETEDPDPGGGGLGGGPISDATRAACADERATLRTAAEAYRANIGRYPASNEDLLESQMIAELPTYYEIGAGTTDNRLQILLSVDGAAKGCPEPG